MSQYQDLRSPLRPAGLSFRFQGQGDFPDTEIAHRLELRVEAAAQ
jgi:hypothetical protein